jgi:CHAT domain-containing protein/Tfp pilus assembly protein PilF
MHARSLCLASFLALGLLGGWAARGESSGLDPRLEAAVALYRAEGADRALPEFRHLAAEFANGAQRRNHAAALHYVGESHWRLGQYAEAHRHLDQALAVERAAGDRVGEGKTLNVLGLLAWDEGDYEQATARFREAGSIARSVGDRRLEGASLNNLGLVQDELGEYDTSLDTYQKVLEIYREADFPRGVGDTLGNIGGVYLLLGRFREAQRYYEQALAISERLESKPSMSQDQGNIGLCLLGLGEIDAAIGRFDRAIALASQAGMRQDEAYWIRQKGNGLIQKGRYAEGLAAHRAALLVYENVGAQTELAIGLHDMGRLHLLLGDADSAERYFSRTLDLAREIGLSRGVTQSLLALGDLSFRRRKLDAAASQFEQARQRATGSGERHLAAESLLRLAFVHRERQQIARAEREVDDALAIARDITARSIEAEALLARAELDRRGGRLQEARNGFDAAQAALAKSGDPELLWQIHFGRARTLEALGDRPGAVKSLRAAVTLIESVRSRLQEPRFRSGYVEDKYEVYVELARLQLLLGRTDDAFDTAERLRARNYAELLGGRVAISLSTEERRIEATLRERMRRLRRAIEDERVDERPAHRQRAVDRLSSELLAAERDYQAFLDDRSSAASGSTPVMVVPALDNIRRRLARDEALVEYLVGPRSLVTFVVTADHLTATTTEVSRADLSARVALLRDLIQRPGDARWLKPAAGLSALLIDRLEDDGQLRGIRRLYVVPHGVLNYLPFALLGRERVGSPELLVDRYTLVHLPTAAALFHRPAGVVPIQSMLAVAPARSRLRHAPEEARSVHAMFGSGAQLLLGKTATESRFKSLAGEFRVLHLATHGDFNSFSPLMSGLELESDAVDDGLLQIHEILGLSLGAELVTLSACETALGSGYFADVPAADEFVGLTRAFLAAGSATVMATLWEVDDRASVEIMKRFYDRLNRLGGVTHAATALAATQRELRGSRDLGHPYFWAPFILAGVNDAKGRPGPDALGRSQ